MVAAEESELKQCHRFYNLTPYISSFYFVLLFHFDVRHVIYSRIGTETFQKAEQMRYRELGLRIRATASIRTPLPGPWYIYIFSSEIFPDDVLTTEGRKTAIFLIKTSEIPCRNGNWDGSHPYKLIT